MLGPARGTRRRLAAAVAVVAGLLLLLAPLPAHAVASREPFAGSQWGIRQIEAEAAWDVTRGRGARVGVIDTGIDLSHAELAGRVVMSTRCINTGGNAARCGGSAQDDSGHGTHVAGIVAAPLDGAGVAGVAPESSLLVVKALESDGSGEAPDVAAGIDWLLAQGVHVVNLSLAETLSPRRVQGSPLEAAIRRAADVGVVVVLAAGNHGEAADGSTGFNLPAIVVGATGRTGRLARYSRPLSTGIRWGMVAPGGDAAGGTQGEVVSTYWFAGRRSSYAWSEGTSMAAPHVAGVAALLATQGVRGEEAVNRILGSAGPANCGTGCRGLLNARAALGATAPAAATGVAGASNAPTPAPIPPEPPPASSVVPATTPAVVAVAPPAPDAAAGPGPGTGEEAAGPVDLSVALEIPPHQERRSLAVRLAAAALLTVATVTGVVATGTVYGRRRVRADEEW